MHAKRKNSKRFITEDSTDSDSDSEDESNSEFKDESDEFE